MDENSSKNGLIVNFCLKHTMGILIFSVFLIALILLFTVSVWAKAQSVRNEIYSERIFLSQEKQAYEKYKSEIPLLKKEYEDSSATLNSVKASLSNNIELIDKSQKDLSELMDQHTKLLKETEGLMELKAQGSSLRKDNENLLKEKSQLSKNIESSKQTIESLKNEIAKLEAKKDEISKKLSVLERDSVELIDKNGKLEAKNQSLEMLISALTADDSEFSKLQRQLAEKVAELNLKNTELEENIESITSSARSLKNTASLVDKSSDSFDELSRIVKNFNAVNKDYESQLKSMSTAAQSLVTAVDKLERYVGDILTGSKALTTLNGDYSEQVRLLKNGLADIKEKLKEFDQASDDLRSLNRVLENSSALVKSLQQKISEIEASKSSNDQDVSLKLKELKELLSEMQIKITEQNSKSIETEADGEE